MQENVGGKSYKKGPRVNSRCWRKETSRRNTRN